MTPSPRLLKVCCHRDARGSLLSFEVNSPLPFPLARFFVIKDVPFGAARAEHPVGCNQLIVAVCGACRALVGPEDERQEFRLESDDAGLLIPSGLWLKLDFFTPGTVLVVACDDVYRGGTKRLEEPASDTTDTPG